MEGRHLGRGGWIAAATVLAAAVACGTGGTDGAGSSPPSTVVPVTASSGTATLALLIFDTEQCRNSGTVEAFGEVWQLADSVPLGWRTSGERDGMLTIINEQNAAFIADDGTELRVTLGGQEDICFTWDVPASSTG